MSNGPIGVYPNAYENQAYNEELARVKAENDAFLNQAALNSQQQGDEESVGTPDINEDTKLMSLFSLLNDIDTRPGFGSGSSGFNVGNAQGMDTMQAYNMGSAVATKMSMGHAKPLVTPV